ncbi:MAG: NUDIX hydrolase [Rhodocyclaceae bacterium]|nr:NUDIX hydrolase [Rhodocyclaceae bacterium]
MAYCRMCGSRLEWAEVDGRRRERCSCCGAVAYRNPAPVCLAMVEHRNGLVMIRRRVDPLAGYWAPPGGYVECGESLSDAVVREVAEECGLVVAVDRVLGVYSQADVNVVIVAYGARSLGGEPLAGDDALEVGLFGRGSVPRQTVPLAASALDRWFLSVINDATATWR